jgi:hypothetical protein
VFRQLSDDYDYCSWRAHTNAASFFMHLGKTEGGLAAFQTQDTRSETAGTEIPIFFISLCLSHLHVLTPVDETFDHIDVTDKIEQFMVARESFTQKLLPVIWKHRAASIAKKAEDEDWLKKVLDDDNQL